MVLSSSFIFGSRARQIVQAEPRLATHQLAIVNAVSKFVLFECGHSHQYLFDVDFFGQVHKRKQTQVRQRQLCGPCTMRLIRTHFRRCACCGFVIMPNEQVSVSMTCVSEYCEKPWDLRLENGYLACMRPECTGNVRQRAGFWRSGGVFESAPPRFEDSGLVDLCTLTSNRRTG